MRFSPARFSHRQISLLALVLWELLYDFSTIPEAIPSQRNNKRSPISVFWQWDLMTSKVKTSTVGFSPKYRCHCFRLTNDHCKNFWKRECRPALHINQASQSLEILYSSVIRLNHVCRSDRTVRINRCTVRYQYAPVGKKKSENRRAQKNKVEAAEHDFIRWVH